VNFFQPSFKSASKTRIGTKVRKTYHASETPYAKLLGFAAVTDEMKARLRAVAMQLDPLRLLEEIRSVQHHLAAMAVGETTHVPPRHEGSVALPGWCTQRLRRTIMSGHSRFIRPIGIGGPITTSTRQSSHDGCAMSAACRSRIATRPHSARGVA